MQLNSAGKLAKFYMWLPPDDKKLPQDLCTYFWGLAGRALFIFGMGGVALLGLIAGLVRVVTWLFWLVTTHKRQVFTVLGLAVFVGLIIWLSKHRQKVKVEILSEARAIVKGKVDAFKGRYCPRIEWTHPSTRLR